MTGFDIFLLYVVFALIQLFILLKLLKGDGSILEDAKLGHFVTAAVFCASGVVFIIYFIFFLPWLWGQLVKERKVFKSDKP